VIDPELAHNAPASILWLQVYTTSFATIYTMADLPRANEDMEAQSSQNEDANVSKQSLSRHPFSTKETILAFISIGSIIWGSIMTALYVREANKNSPRVVSDAQLRSNGALGMAALSHINVVVNDSIDDSASYYQMLGFYPATNAARLMKYTNITNHGFCVDAGFESCRADTIFLKHEMINIHL